MGRRAPAVLLVEDHQGTRDLYVDALTAIGCNVQAIGSDVDVVAIVARALFDIAVLDIGLSGGTFAEAERLAALPNRPRLIAVTARGKTRAPIEMIFDRYLVKPCLPGDLVEAVRSVATTPVQERDLLIIARDRVGIHDVLQRLGDSVARVEMRLDLRRGERRHDPHRRAAGERRRKDRRALDVSDQLRTNGWAFVPAVSRG